MKYNIILDDENYTAPWDKFSDSISKLWNWEDDTKSIDEYKVYFTQAMCNEGMLPDIEPETGKVKFTTPADLTVFLLKWA